MRGHWKSGSFLVLTFLILGSLFWSLFYFGLLQHWLVKGQIVQLTGLARDTAESEFYALGKADHLWAGTLAKINLRDAGGVWLWSNQGLKYFQADEYTFYSYYDVCAARNKSEGKEYQINDDSRQVMTDINRWAKLAQPGNFVQLLLTTADNGGKPGNLREIYAYSQPLFLPLRLESACQN